MRLLCRASETSTVGEEKEKGTVPLSLQLMDMYCTLLCLGCARCQGRGEAACFLRAENTCRTELPGDGFSLT